MLEERLQKLRITKSNGTLGLAKKLSVLKTNNTRVSSDTSSVAREMSTKLE